METTSTQTEQPSETTENIVEPLTNTQRAFEFACAMNGNGTLRKARYIKAPLYAPYIHSGGMGTSVVIDINGVREVAALDPVVVTGAFYQMLKKNLIDVTRMDAEGKTIVEQKIPTYQDREKMLTPVATSYMAKVDDEEFPSQGIYLVIRRSCGGDMTERPSYTLVIESEAEPIEVPLDLWVYNDGVFVEAARNGFNSQGGAASYSNRVQVDGNTSLKNNLKAVIGWILSTLNTLELPLESSTSVTYASRQEHSQDRKAALNGGNKNGGGNRMAMVGASASGAPAQASQNRVDPFASAEARVG